jgi:tetratricopeptide (TPR) repeat protein
MFYALLLLQLTVVIWTFRDYGITIDEPPHARYGRDIVNWYLSGFERDEFLDAENMLFYGGLFDTLVHPLTQISPLDIHDTRHLCNALVGLLAVIGAYRLGAYLGSPLTGLMAALFLILTPRFYGHIFNNPKDIPFAAAYIWSLYFLVRSVTELPNLSRRTLLKTGVSIGLTMAIRVGGFILLFYTGLFFLLRYVQLASKEESAKEFGLRAARKFLAQVLSIALLAYALMLPTWPRALIDPLTYPFHVLRVFSHFTYYVTTFFEGSEITWIEIPWYYVPKWLSMVVPEFLFLALLLGVVGLLVNRKALKFDGVSLPWYLLGFASFSPPAYAVLIGSPLGDGLRHFLFVFPSVAVLAASGFTTFLRNTSGKWIRRGFVGLMSLLMVSTAWDMIHLHPNQYIYFNRWVAGGLEKASLQFQTDYWENSYKQGVRWLDENYPVPAGGRLRLGGASDNVQYLLDASRYQYVAVPEPERMDIYLSTTRADGHRMVPGEVIKTIDQDGVPLLYIIRPDSTYNDDPFFASVFDRNFRLGYFANKSADLDAAIRAYRRIVAAGAADEVVFNNLGASLFMQGDLEGASAIYRQALDIYPGYLNAKLSYANVLIGLEQYPAAAEVLRGVLAQNPLHYQAWKLLGLARHNSGNFSEAISSFERAIQIQPEVSDLQYHLGLAYLAKTDTGSAMQAFERVGARSENYSFAQEDLADLLLKKGDVQRAEKAYNDLIDSRPNRIAAYYKLADLFIDQNRLAEATRLLERALYIDPNNGSLSYLMGRVHLALGQVRLAKGHFAMAMASAPSDRTYRNALFQAGTVAHQNGMPDIAREAYEQILSEIPDFGGAHLNLGILNFSEQRYAEAVENFSRAAVILPTDMEALLGLAQSYERVGRVKEAENSYRKVLALQADNEIARKGLSGLRGRP